MRKLAKNFDRVSDVYRDIAQPIYQPIVANAIQQIQHQQKRANDVKEVIDLGCGDGSTLQRISTIFPRANYTGIDISQSMIAKVHEKIKARTMLLDLSQSKNALPKLKYDLVLAHFLLGYIELETLLNKIKPLLRTTSLVSLATSTENSFGNIKNLVKACKSNVTPLKNFIDYKIKKGIKESKNKIDWLNIDSIFDKHGFELLTFKTISIDCLFKKPEELFNSIYYGGWGIGELNTYLPLCVYQFFYSKALSLLVDFPFRDQAEINVLTLKLKNIKKVKTEQ